MTCVAGAKRGGGGGGGGGGRKEPLPLSTPATQARAVDKRPRGKVPLRRQENSLEFFKIIPTRGKYD